eukprot:2283405-Rhodomonas_salina.1
MQRPRIGLKAQQLKAARPPSRFKVDSNAPQRAVVLRIKWLATRWWFLVFGFVMFPRSYAVLPGTTPEEYQVRRRCWHCQKKRRGVWSQALADGADTRFRYLEVRGHVEC